MRSSRATFVLAAVGLGSALLPAGAIAGDDPAVDLLRLPEARVESSTALGDDAKELRALADGDPAAVATVSASEKAPFDVVYGFGEGTVSPERLRVTLPAAPAADARIATVEILVSTISSTAGFRSVRVDPPAATGKPQDFDFPAAAAKWVMLRFTPAPKATRVQVADVSVLGRRGPPKSRYEFAESPAKALDVLARLERTSSLNISASADERALFAKAAAAPLDAAGFADAALLASGVQDAAKRRAYLAKIDDLERQVRPLVEAKTSIEEKGEALLRALHAGPMAKGYLAHQTDLSAVLDTGRFNCVSSALLFDVLAVRFGLDARAIEVPDHAFSIVYDGTRHMDVETTTPQGFNPARNRAGLEQFEKTTGFRYIPDAHRDKRREVGAAGLVAIVYYNHGVLLGEEKRWHEALGAYFRAMSLDSEFASAVKNALAILANWSGELAKQGAFEEALAVAATGLALAPKDAALVHNHGFVWHEWARTLVEAGKRDEALAVLARAHAAIPDGRFLSMRTWVFVEAGEEHAKAKRWAEALSATEVGLQRLEGKPLEDLKDWRASLRLRWVTSAVEAGRFEDAAAATDQALASDPSDARFRRNAAYVAQEWLRHEQSAAGISRAVEVGRALVARWSSDPEIAKVAGRHVRRAAQELAEAGKPEEALSALDAGKALLPDAKDLREARVYVWDVWAKAKMKQGAFAEAADVYARGLSDAPGESLLLNNVAFLAQEWTKAAYAAGGDAEAAKVAEVLKKKFPTVPAVAASGGKQVRRTVDELVKNGDFEGALAALDAAAGRLEKPGDAKELSFHVHDAWARKLMAAKKWAEAADVYVKALARHPDDGKIRGNAAYLAQEWGQAAAAEAPTKAVEALRTMVSKFQGVDEVKRAARNHVGRSVGEVAQAGKYEEALALLDASKDLLTKDSDVLEVSRSVYDRWAQAKSDAKDWQGAVDVYAAALKRHPGDGHMTNNAQATWDEWARTFSGAKDWDGAIAVYDKALAAFPDSSLLKGNRAYAVQEKGKK